MPKRGKNRLLLIGLAALFWGASPVTMALADSPICAGCHEQITDDFQTSYHARAWTDKTSSCHSCHGSADPHLNNPSPETIISFSKESERETTELNRQCLKCHDSSPHVSLWDMSSHSSNEVACVDCHTIHIGNPEVDEPAVCYHCHGSVRMAASKISHHPLRENKIECSDCHNSHGSLAHNMLTEDNINQLCYRCHAEKRGPFIWEHPPVEEDCSICHTPHGSRHENLMREKVVNLCQDCHSNPELLHANRAYDEDSGFGAKRFRSIGFVARSCLNCHGNIHGSTHFENHGLTR